MEQSDALDEALTAAVERVAAERRARRSGRGQRQRPADRRGQAPDGQAGDPLHPKHGSWPNIAEIELSVLGRQCPDRRLSDLATLDAEVAAWQQRRDRDGGRVDWRFTTEDARIRPKRLYPSVHE